MLDPAAQSILARSMSTPSVPWWRRASFYQVYVRSFADGDGDGTGDIAGLRSRLPYLRSLGVDAIWVNPWYRSPLHDGGYDVADYRQIDPRFGTLDEAIAFIDEAARMGIRVLVDLVPNHTSSEHVWFRAALDSAPGSPERARYIFRPGRGADGSQPPTDWESVFGGPAWTRVDDGEWYLHLFDRTQPDLDWTNPDVVTEFHDILRFWLDRGAAGFRVDVAHGLAKDQSFPDLPGDRHEVLHAVAETAGHPFWDRPEIHPIVRGWRRVLDEYPGDRMMVAEAWVANWRRLADYLRPDEYHQAFDFEFLEAGWDAGEMRAAIDSSLSGAASVDAVPTWVLSNHDVIRHPTRYGLPAGVEARQWLVGGDPTVLDEELGLRRARAATLLMMALPGSLYLYQGEELGLHEVWDLPEEVLDDPVWERSGHAQKGRDGCRVPLPWSTEGPSFGFGSGSPWLPQPGSWGAVSVQAQDGDPDSTLTLYRSALSVRTLLLTGDESLEWFELASASTLAFRRGSGVTCVVNLGESPVQIPSGEVLIESRPGAVDSGMLAADSAAWIR